MSTKELGSRLGAGMCNPWVLLLSTIAGGVLWALGNSVTVSAALSAVMIGAAGLTGALSRRGGKAMPLRPGTRQRELVGLFDGYLRSIRELATRDVPDLVRTGVQEAVTAADLARPSLLQVAAAVDALDHTVATARGVSGQGKHAAASISMAVGRLRERRTALLGRLTAGVDEVATVYAALLELSVTSRTIGIAVDDSAVGAVNESVALLQKTFADLEADANGLNLDGHG